MRVHFEDRGGEQKLGEDFCVLDFIGHQALLGPVLPFKNEISGLVGNVKVERRLVFFPHRVHQVGKGMPERRRFSEPLLNGLLNVLLECLILDQPEPSLDRIRKIGRV